MRAIVLKEFQELRRDRRTLVLLIAMPLLLLVIFGYAANFTISHLEVAVYGPATSKAIALIRANPNFKDHVDLVATDRGGSSADAHNELRDAAADVAIYATTGSGGALDAQVYIDGSNLFAAQSARTVFAQAQQQIAQQAAAAQAKAAAAAQIAADAAATEQAAKSSGMLGATGDQPGAAAPGTGAAGTGAASPGADAAAAGQPSAPTLAVTTLFNPDLKTSWVMIPGIIGLILTFIGTIITSIGLVREREAGTLEQLAVMPLKPSAVVLGKISPYFLLACVDMALITVLGLWLFGVPFAGDPLIFIVGAALFLFVVLGLGVLISSVSKTTGQAIQLAFMVLLPQILLSGMIFPLQAMAAGVRWIGYILPLTWFTEISRGVMLRGAGWNTLWLPLVILAVMAVVIFGLAVVRLSGSISPAKPKRHARAHAASHGAAGEHVAEGRA
jgi:ABC-2 type transport system permease protein